MRTTSAIGERELRQVSREITASKHTVWDTMLGLKDPTNFHKQTKLLKALYKSFGDDLSLYFDFFYSLIFRRWQSELLRGRGEIEPQHSIGGHFLSDASYRRELPLQAWELRCMHFPGNKEIGDGPR